MAEATSLTRWEPNQGGDVNIKLAAGLPETLVGAEVEVDRQVLDRVSNRAIAVRQVWGDRLSFVSRQKLKAAILRAERWRDVEWKDPVSLPGALGVRELMEQFVARETARKDARWRGEALVASSAEQDLGSKTDIFQFIYGRDMPSIDAWRSDDLVGLRSGAMSVRRSEDHENESICIDNARRLLTSLVEDSLGVHMEVQNLWVRTDDIMTTSMRTKRSKTKTGPRIVSIIPLLTDVAVNADSLTHFDDKAKLLTFCLTHASRHAHEAVDERVTEDFKLLLSSFEYYEQHDILPRFTDSADERRAKVRPHMLIKDRKIEMPGMPNLSEDSLCFQLLDDLEVMYEVVLGNRSGKLALVKEADEKFVPTREELDFVRSILGVSSTHNVTEDITVHTFGNGDEAYGILTRGPSVQKSLCQFIRDGCNERDGLRWANAEYTKYVAEEGLDEPHVDETFSPIPETTNRKVAELAGLTISSHGESKSMMASIDAIVQNRKKYRTQVFSLSQGTYGAVIHVDRAARVSIYAGIDDRPDNPFILFGKARLSVSKHLGLFELAMRDVFVSKLKDLRCVSLRALRKEIDPQTVSEKELVTEIALTLADRSEACVTSWYYNGRFAKAVLRRETSGPWGETWINKIVRRRRGLKFVFDDTLFIAVSAEVRNENILSLTLGSDVYRLRNVPGSYSRYVKTQVEIDKSLEQCEVVCTERLELEVD